jgi:hypothetical protein
VILLRSTPPGGGGERLDERPAARELGEVELPLPFVSSQVAPLLDPRRQLRRHRALGASQQHRPKLRAQERARVRRRVGRVEALAERRTRPEVAGVHEGRDAPEVEGAVLERRAGEREAMLRLQRRRGARHRGVRVLDVLRLVEDDRAEIDGTPALGVSRRRSA